MQAVVRSDTQRPAINSAMAMMQRPAIAVQSCLMAELQCLLLLTLARIGFRQKGQLPDQDYS